MKALISVAVRIVTDLLAERLVIPDLHVGVELFHFAHEHQSRQPVRHPRRGDDSMHHALMKGLQRRQCMKEGQSEVRRPDEEIHHRWAQLETCGIEEEQVVAIEQANGTVERHDIHVAQVFIGKVGIEQVHLVGMGLRMSMSHDDAQVGRAGAFGFERPFEFDERNGIENRFMEEIEMAHIAA